MLTRFCQNCRGKGHVRLYRSASRRRYEIERDAEGKPVRMYWRGDVQVQVPAGMGVCAMCKGKGTVEVPSC